MYKEPKHIDNIIEGCKGDDRKSQEQLYLYFYDSMMNLCMRYTNSETDAEHVLNSGFLRVFRSIQQYNPAKGTLYTWIHKIVTNCCLYYLKTKKNIVVANELVEAGDVSIEPEIFLKMSDEGILNLIRALPETTQAVFNLFIIDGYGHKEIGGLLQISEGTSKWHLNEARKRLKLQILPKEKNIE